MVETRVSRADSKGDRQRYRSARFSNFEETREMSSKFENRGEPNSSVSNRERRDQTEPQHFLNFFPLPQGHGSFRPTFGVSRLIVILGSFDSCCGAFPPAAAAVPAGTLRRAAGVVSAAGASAGPSVFASFERAASMFSKAVMWEADRKSPLQISWRT